MKVELPNGHFANYDDEAIATALGKARCLGHNDDCDCSFYRYSCAPTPTAPLSLVRPGYAAHLVLMISKYQQVPLRYRIIPLCSRAVIVDDISDIPPTKSGRR